MKTIMLLKQHQKGSIWSRDFFLGQHVKGNNLCINLMNIVSKGHKGLNEHVEETVKN